MHKTLGTAVLIGAVVLAVLALTRVPLGSDCCRIDRLGKVERSYLGLNVHLVPVHGNNRRRVEVKDRKGPRHGQGADEGARLRKAQPFRGGRTRAGERPDPYSTLGVNLNLHDGRKSVLRWERVQPLPNERYRPIVGSLQPRGSVGLHVLLAHGQVTWLPTNYRLESLPAMYPNLRRAAVRSVQQVAVGRKNTSRLKERTTHHPGPWVDHPQFPIRQCCQRVEQPAAPVVPKDLGYPLTPDHTHSAGGNGDRRVEPDASPVRPVRPE